MDINNRIAGATDIYMKSYERALNEYHDLRLAAQCATAVLMVLMQNPEPQSMNPLMQIFMQSQVAAQKKSDDDKS